MMSKIRSTKTHLYGPGQGVQRETHRIYHDNVQHQSNSNLQIFPKGQWGDRTQMEMFEILSEKKYTRFQRRDRFIKDVCILYKQL